MNLILSKVENLKTEFRNSFKGNDESLAGLELRFLSSAELDETGFINRNVEKIFENRSPGFENDIASYFDLKCRNLMLNEIDRIDYPDRALTAVEYIYWIKYAAVKTSVRREITIFLNDLKNEKCESGNTSDSSLNSANRESDKGSGPEAEDTIDDEDLWI